MQVFEEARCSIVLFSGRKWRGGWRRLKERWLKRRSRWLKTLTRLTGFIARRRAGSWREGWRKESAALILIKIWPSGGSSEPGLIDFLSAPDRRERVLPATSSEFESNESFCIWETGETGEWSCRNYSREGKMILFFLIATVLRGGQSGIKFEKSG